MFPRILLWAWLAGVAMLGHGQLLMGADPTNDPAGTAPAGPSKEAIERAGAPIPLAPDSKTQKDARVRYLDWFRRRMLPPALTAAKGQPWEAGAVKYVNDYFAIWAGAGAGEEEGAEIFKRQITCLQD